MERYILFTFMLIILYGCEAIKDDLSGCGTDNNCVIMFRLEDKDGRDILIQKIMTVDALLYDAEYRLVDRKKVTREELLIFQGVRFTVEPGTYYVVCWGNVTEHSMLSTGNLYFRDGSVQAMADDTGSPLYFAPLRLPGEIYPGASEGDYSIHRLDVSAQRVTEETIDFCRAHRTINIYLKGFTEISDPVVYIDGFADKYDFFFRTYSSRRAYEQRAIEEVQTPDGQMKRAVFDVPISPFREEMETRISDGPEQDVKVIRNIKQYVDANVDKIEDLNELHIILVMNHNGEVTITAPDWGLSEVEPVW